MNNEMYEVIDSVPIDDGTIVEVLQFPQLTDLPIKVPPLHNHGLRGRKQEH